MLRYGVGFHYTGANWDRDISPALAERGEQLLVADIRNVVEGDPSPDGKGRLVIRCGIEMGHVFYLGTKYSSALNAAFIDDDGKSKVIEMGCCGIGVTRLLGAANVQNHDERAVAWARPIVPFDAVICPSGNANLPRRARGDPRALRGASRGWGTLLDGRDRRPG